MSRHLPRATIVDGERATEAVVKRVHGPRVLHLATHGFFLDDRDWAIASRRELRARPETAHPFYWAAFTVSGWPSAATTSAGPPAVTGCKCNTSTQPPVWLALIIPLATRRRRKRQVGSGTRRRRE